MANVVAQLVILMHDDGTVGINGPLENKMLAYSMLEVAKDEVRKRADKAAEGGGQIIQVAPGTRLASKG